MVKRAADSNLSLKKTEPKKFKKEPRLHKSIFEVGGLPDGTEVIYRTPEKDFLGIKQGFGIVCLHCNKQVKPTEFEAHAGMGTRKKPYENIYLESGMSLHDYALQLKLKNQNLVNNDAGMHRVRETGRDVLCGRCQTLVPIEDLSETGTSRELVCQKCAKKRVGPNPAKKIASDSFACVLCRDYDFVEVGFHDRTSIICEQCEKEHHVGCLNQQKETELKELPEGNWYCTPVCQEIFYELKQLTKCGPQKVPDHLLDLIRKKFKEGDADHMKRCDVKFHLICGKDVKKAFEDNRMLLGYAIEIFHEQFRPIIDKQTRRDFITRMAYGSYIGKSFVFSGVYTAMLTVNDKVVTAGMFRVFGEAPAELSIVATSKQYKQKGYFNVLFNCIEKILSYLCIKKIVVLASANAKSMWIEKFGFENLAKEQLEEYRKTQPSMLAFMGTSVLEKKVRTGERTFRNSPDFKL